MATEFAVYATNVLITASEVATNSFCRTWTSVPGIHYFVQGNTNLSSTNWTAVSPTLTANDSLTSWCLALPSPYHFFRVQEGLVLSPYLPPSGACHHHQHHCLDQRCSAAMGALLLNSQFGVQWTPSLPPSCVTSTNTITSTNGSFSFLLSAIGFRPHWSRSILSPAPILGSLRRFQQRSQFPREQVREPLLSRRVHVAAAGKEDIRQCGGQVGQQDVRIHPTIPLLEQGPTARDFAGSTGFSRSWRQSHAELHPSRDLRPSRPGNRKKGTSVHSDRAAPGRALKVPKLNGLP